MHGLAGIKDTERTPLRGSLVIFETIPPIFFCRSLAAIVMHCGDGMGWIDRIEDAGQSRRLRWTPSWWYRTLLLWIDDPSMLSSFGSPRCGNLPNLVNGGMHTGLGEGAGNYSRYSVESPPGPKTFETYRHLPIPCCHRVLPERRFAA